MRAGIGATALSALVVVYTFIPPYNLRFHLSANDGGSLVTFALTGLSVDLFCFWRRTAERRQLEAHVRLASLQEHAARLLKRSDTEAVAAAAVNESVRMSGAAGGFVARPAASGGGASILGALRCNADALDSWSRTAGTPLADAFFTQRPLLLKDPAQMAREYPAFSGNHGTETQALALIPLRVRGRRHGILCLTFSSPQKFRQEEVDLIMTCADQAAEALDQRELLDSVDRRLQEFNVISEASLAFSESELEAEAILGTLVEVCVQYLADCALAYRSVDGGLALECVAGRSKENGATGTRPFTAGRLRAGEGLSGSVAATGRGRVLHQLPAEIAAAESEVGGPSDGCSAISVPIKARGQVLGVLTMVRWSPESFSQTHGELAQEVARRAGLALVAAGERAEAQQELDLRRKVEDDLRLNQARLQEALAAKDEFLGLVSHELRTPLTTVRGNADILKRRPNLPEELRNEAIADVATDSERLSRIVENMLLLARLDAGKKPDLEPVLLYRVVVQAKEEFLRESPKALLCVHPMEDELIVEGNEAYIRQILQNLYSNAVKYCPPGLPIEVSVRAAQDLAVVEVADRGVGIDPETAEELFRPFYRENDQNPQVSGLGIGLAVCKRLVEAQGGTIEARPREGGGSVFSFVLPIWPE